MIRAALVGMTTVVGVGAVLSYQPADVLGLPAAAPADQPPDLASSGAAPLPSPSATTAPPVEQAASPPPATTSAPPSSRPSATPSVRVTDAATSAPATPREPSASSSPARPTPTPTRSATPTPSSTPTATPTPTPTGPRTWTGAVAITPYGNVQVALVVDGGVVVDAYALQFPSEHPTSREIASYALPELRRQTLEAQSAAIAGVSGASYDTAGWVTSLQSALSKADL